MGEVLGRELGGEEFVNTPWVEQAALGGYYDALNEDPDFVRELGELIHVFGAFVDQAAVDAPAEAPGEFHLFCRRWSLPRLDDLLRSVRISAATGTPRLRVSGFCEYLPPLDTARTFQLHVAYDPTKQTRRTFNERLSEQLERLRQEAFTWADNLESAAAGVDGAEAGPHLRRQETYRRIGRRIYLRVKGLTWKKIAIREGKAEGGEERTPEAVGKDVREWAERLGIPLPRTSYDPPGAHAQRAAKEG